jgi:hypothetical protein
MNTEGRRPDQETESERRRNNIALAIFFVAIVGIGIWLVNALVDCPQGG